MRFPNPDKIFRPALLYSEVHFWEELKLFVYLIAYSSFSFVKTFILFMYVLHVRPFKWYISTFWPFILYIIHICQLISYLEVSNHGGVLASTFDCSFKKYPFVLKKISIRTQKISIRTQKIVIKVFSKCFLENLFYK